MGIHNFLWVETELFVQVMGSLVLIFEQVNVFADDMLNIVVAKQQGYSIF